MTTPAWGAWELIKNDRDRCNPLRPTNSTSDFTFQHDKPATNAPAATPYKISRLSLLSLLLLLLLLLLQLLLQHSLCVNIVTHNPINSFFREGKIPPVEQSTASSTSQSLLNLAFFSLPPCPPPLRPNGKQKAYLLCKEPQKAADAFHSATSIVWPDLPPWPTPPSAARGQDRRKDRRRVRNDVYHTNTNANANATAGASPEEYELPDDFLQLKAGPPQELNGGLESAVSSWEKGTWVRRLSQMQTGVGISLPAAGTAARRSALGGHAGDCRPNGFLVATVVKAHGKRRRPDDACRTVLRMADWGLRPDAAVFNSLAAALVWNGRLDLAVEVPLNKARSGVRRSTGK